MSPIIEQTLTAKELANALGASLNTVYRLKLMGHVPYWQLGGKHHMVRFPASVLEMLTQPSQFAATQNSKTKKPISGPMPKWIVEIED